MTAVKTSDLWFALDGVDIVRGISLAVETGEFVAVEGPSGSGKTTLLNLIAGLEQPTAGSVIVDGVAINELDQRDLTVFRRRNIGVVFQRYDLLPTLTAWQNVAVPQLLDGGSFAAAKDRACRLLADVGLADQVEQRPGSLSGGEQQRVAIARALMNDPALLLADEPTGALDSVAGDGVLAVLSEASEQGHTVLLVTHEPRAAAYAGRSIRLLDGRVVDHRTQ